MNKGLIGKVVGVVVSLAVLYGLVYVAGKGWKKSQQN
jgi:hypothetical protein